MNPPSEKPLISWLYVLLWSLVIFVTIPLARILQEFVERQWGREVFTYSVLATIVVALVAAAVYVYRSRPALPNGYLWLLVVAAIFFVYTIKLGKKSPEEAIHFVQYGMLGILVYRALAHRLRDVSIYIATALVCGIIGTIDEAIQWLTPDRYWGIDDIWLNFFAASLVQIAIAGGLKPTLIDRRPNRANLRFLCRLTIGTVTLFGICLLNTPARITWFAERVLWLEFLKENESVMAEYGHRFEDIDIGIFRSRLSPTELKASDRLRSIEVAKILDRFQDPEKYPLFLKIFTPVSDPFVHEARVHLFSRDQNYLYAMKVKANQVNFAKHLTTAFRENQILEKYFPNTLYRSAYVWSSDKLALSRNHLLNDQVYDSWVSINLITQFSEAQVSVFFILLIIGLVLLHWYLGKGQSMSSPS